MKAILILAVVAASVSLGAKQSEKPRWASEAVSTVITNRPCVVSVGLSNAQPLNTTTNAPCKASCPKAK